MANIRQAITPTTGLALTNSMIEVNDVEKEMLAWKQKYSHYHFGDRVLGMGYWKGFCKRNKDKIWAKKGEKFNKDRCDWTMYQNFDVMYNDVYDQMVEEGVAEKLVEPVWMDSDGNVLDTKKCEEMLRVCRRKVTHRILHPAMCVVADEVGGNTAQKGDGYVGGKKTLSAWKCPTGQGCNGGLSFHSDGFYSANW